MNEHTGTGAAVSLLRSGDGAFCPYYHRAIEIIGRRWAGAVIRSLLAGLTRFNEIAAASPGMSHRVLAQRLRDLEHDGILVREVHHETPVRIQYRLTDKGQALAEPVITLTAWAEHWLRDQPDAQPGPPTDECRGSTTRRPPLA